MGQATVEEDEIVEMYSPDLRLPVLPDVAPPLCEALDSYSLKLPSVTAPDFPSEGDSSGGSSPLSLQYHDNVHLRLRLGPRGRKTWYPAEGAKRCGLHYFGNLYELFRIDLRVPPVHRLGTAVGELQFWHRHWNVDRNSNAVERVVLSVLLRDAGGYLPVGVDRSSSRSNTLALLQSSEQSPKLSAPLNRLLTSVRHGHVYTYHQTQNRNSPCRSPVDWIVFREKVSLSGEESALVAGAAGAAGAATVLSSVQLTCRDKHFRVLEVYPPQR